MLFIDTWICIRISFTVLLLRENAYFIRSNIKCGLGFFWLEVWGFRLGIALFGTSDVGLLWPVQVVDISTIATTLFAMVSIFLLVAWVGLFAWVFPFAYMVHFSTCFSKSQICLVWVSTIWDKESNFNKICFYMKLSFICSISRFFCLSGSDINERSLIDFFWNLDSPEILVRVISNLPISLRVLIGERGILKLNTEF